jgi:thiol-disulfide isomerase/thioredoxin
MATKLTIEDMIDIAKKKGGKCLSKKYINIHTLLKWQCKQGHEWMSSPAHIKYTSWCPYCAGLVKKTIEEMYELAKNKGGQCLSKEYINSKSNLKWRCKEGHEWFARFDSIRLSQWCPKCARQRMIGNTYRLGKIKNKELQKNGL